MCAAVGTVELVDARLSVYSLGVSLAGVHVSEYVFLGSVLDSVVSGPASGGHCPECHWVVKCEFVWSASFDGADGDMSRVDVDVTVPVCDSANMLVEDSGLGESVEAVVGTVVIYGVEPIERSGDESSEYGPLLTYVAGCVSLCVLWSSETLYGDLWYLWTMSAGKGARPDIGGSDSKFVDGTCRTKKDTGGVVSVSVSGWCSSEVGSFAYSCTSAVVADNVAVGYVSCFGDATCMCVGYMAETDNIDVEGCSASVDVSIHVVEVMLESTADPVISIGVVCTVSGFDSLVSPVNDDVSVNGSSEVGVMAYDLSRWTLSRCGHCLTPDLYSVDPVNVGFGKYVGVTSGVSHSDCPALELTLRVYSDAHRRNDVDWLGCLWGGEV